MADGNEEQQRLNRLRKLSTVRPDRVQQAFYGGNGRSEYLWANRLPGTPGSPRGVYESMYVGRPWTTRQYAGYGTAVETNKIYRDRYANGDKGMSVAFDILTHHGLNSDNETYAAEVGMSGVALDSAYDFERLFEGVPLGDVSVSMTMNGAVLQSLAGLIVAARNQGVDPKFLRGTIQNDPIKELNVRNTEMFGVSPSMRIATDIIEFCSTNLPKFNPISISGYHYQEGGAFLHEELGYMLAAGVEYIETMKSRGIAVDDFAPQLSFFYSVGIDFFGEIAKMRAGRILWERYVSELGATTDDAKRMRFHSHTSGVSLQSKDPMFNIVRSTIESMAAVLGGTQSLHTSSYDEGVRLPSDDARRISEATQKIMLEAGLHELIDPFGGSFAIEEMTMKMVRDANDVVKEIASNGGIRAVTENGWLRERITRSAAVRQAWQDSGQTKIVGVNEFVDENAPELDGLSIDATATRKAQLASIEYVRSHSDVGEVERLTGHVTNAALGNQNLMPPVIDAMAAGATWEDITTSLTKAFGPRERVAVVSIGTYANEMKTNEEFLATQHRVETASQARGAKPKMLLVTFGLDGHDRGPNIVAAGFKDAGFDVVWSGVISETPKSTAHKIANDPSIDVIGVSCHSGAHVAQVDEMMKELSRLNPNRKVVVAMGGVIPSDDHDTLHAMGVDVIFPQSMKISEGVNKILDLMDVPTISDVLGSRSI